MLARARSLVCACPTTERNLGDGVVPADLYFKTGVRLSLGADSHTQVDLLEDARELEYNMRLSKLQRVVLTTENDGPSALAASLFECATRNGAESIGAQAGALEAGRPADFFTIDLSDPSVAGASTDDLLSHIVFSLSLTAVRDVVVGGRPIVRDGRHGAQGEITESFVQLQRRLWD
jgi:formimidoylglutamate deiminase